MPILPILALTLTTISISGPVASGQRKPQLNQTEYAALRRVCREEIAHPEWNHVNGREHIRVFPLARRLSANQIVTLTASLHGEFGHLSWERRLTPYLTLSWFIAQGPHVSDYIAMAWHSRKASNILLLTLLHEQNRPSKLLIQDRLSEGPDQFSQRLLAFQQWYSGTPFYVPWEVEFWHTATNTNQLSRQQRAFIAIPENSNYGLAWLKHGKNVVALPYVKDDTLYQAGVIVCPPNGQVRRPTMAEHDHFYRVLNRDAHCCRMNL